MHDKPTSKRIFVILAMVLLLIVVIFMISNIPTQPLLPQQIKEAKPTYEVRGDAQTAPAAREISLNILTIAGKNLEIEILDSNAERVRGLSGRESLAPDHGLLFVFEKSERYGFWMKDMNFPIDMIWIDADKKVIHIEKNVQPASYPHIYIPATPALYVLEVVAGFSEQNGLKVGDLATF